MGITIKKRIDSLNNEERDLIQNIESTDTKKIYAKKPALGWWLFLGILSVIYLIGVIAGINGMAKNIQETEFTLFAFVTVVSLILFSIFFKLFHRSSCIYFHPKNFYLAKPKNAIVERIGNRVTIIPNVNIKEIKDRAIYNYYTRLVNYLPVIVYTENGREIKECYLARYYKEIKLVAKLMG
jgi:hypothetical protein